MALLGIFEKFHTLFRVFRAERGYILKAGEEGVWLYISFFLDSCITLHLSFIFEGKYLVLCLGGWVWVVDWLVGWLGKEGVIIIEDFFLSLLSLH